MPPRLNLYAARSLLRSTCQCHAVTPSSYSSSQLAGDYALHQRRSHKKRASSSAAITRRTSASTSTHRSFTPAPQCCSQRRLNSSSSAKSDPEKGESGSKEDGEGGEGGGGDKEPWASKEDALPHASEEAAEIAKIMEKKSCGVGGDVGGPELEQGTPVMDVSFAYLGSILI